MRFYSKETPNVDDIVMCHVDRIQDFCIYVKLLEYDNMEGMVQLADASTRRKRKSVCLLKVNKKYPLLVIRVDKENKYIDLSNKFLSEEDKTIATEKFNNYFFVMKLFKRFLSKKFNGKYSEDTYLDYAKKTFWKLQSNKCYDYLVNNYMNNDNYKEFDINDNERDILTSIIKESLGEINFTSTLNFMARNANLEGISRIQKIFLETKEKFNEDVMINVAPNYYVIVESSNSNENIEKLEKINDYIESQFKSHNCLYKKMDINTKNSIS